MNPSDVRHELVGQHRQLRSRLEDARLTLARTASTKRTRAFREALAQVAEMFCAQRLREEELWPGIFPVLDGWGRTRADALAEEYRELYEALLDASTSPDRRVAVAAANALFDRIEEHMDRSERMLRAEKTRSNSEVRHEARPSPNRRRRPSLSAPVPRR